MAWIGNVSNIKNKNDVKKAMDYIVRSSKTKKKNHCFGDIGDYYIFSTVRMFKVSDTDMVSDLWSAIRKQYGKDDKILTYHFVQSLNPKHEITAEESFEIGKKLAEKIFAAQGFEYIVSTHIDKGIIHNHILVNNVSTTAGKKYKHDKHTYQQMRKENVDICRQFGINAVDTGKNFLNQNMRDVSYNDLALYGRYKEEVDIKTGREAYVKTEAYKRWKSKENSNIAVIKKDICTAIKYSVDWNDFIINMQSKGYKIDHKTKSGTDKRYVTYFAPGAERGRRDRKLGQRFTKEAIVKRIQKRLEYDIKHEEYFQRRREKNIEYKKDVMEREKNKYLALKRRRLNQKFEIPIGVMCIHYNKKYRGLNLVRMTKLEQVCKIQYQKYKDAAINYEMALEEKDSSRLHLSPVEYQNIVSNIQSSIYRIGIVKKYHISSSKDINIAKRKIFNEREQMKEKVEELEKRVEKYDEKLYLEGELKKYIPVYYEYEMLQGEQREKYREDHIIELDRFQIIKRELKSSEDIQENNYQEIKNGLCEKINKLQKKLEELSEEEKSLNKLKEEYFDFTYKERDDM